MVEQKKGLFGGNLLPKILILFAVGVIVSAVLFGLPASIPDVFWFIVRIIVGLAIFWFALAIIQKVVLPQKNFSPSESWKHKLIPLAEQSRPPRTKRLFLRGEDMHIHYYFGRITGLLFLPNWVGVPVIDKLTGKFKYAHKCDKNGKPLYDGEGNPILVHELSNITEKDGDWLFVITRGLLPALSKKILVRANVELVSGIGEDVWIKAVNLVPVGDYYFPNQQYQADIMRINMQSLAENIEETHQHFLDMCATTTESSLRSDPMFVKMMQANTETISSKESAPINSLGANR